MLENKKRSEYSFPIELFTVGNKYSRDDINQRLEKGSIDGYKGVTEFLNCFALVVTLEKKDKPKNQKYKDFLKTEKNFSRKVSSQKVQEKKKMNLDHQIRHKCVA